MREIWKKFIELVSSGRGPLAPVINWVRLDKSGRFLSLDNQI